MASIVQDLRSYVAVQSPCLEGCGICAVGFKRFSATPGHPELLLSQLSGLEVSQNAISVSSTLHFSLHAAILIGWRYAGVEATLAYPVNLRAKRRSNGAAIRLGSILPDLRSFDPWVDSSSVRAEVKAVPEPEANLFSRPVLGTSFRGTGRVPLHAGDLHAVPILTRETDRGKIRSCHRLQEPP